MTRKAGIVIIIFIIAVVSFCGIISGAKDSSAEKFVSTIQTRQRSLLSVQQDQDQLMEAFKKCYTEKEKKKVDLEGASEREGATF